MIFLAFLGMLLFGPRKLPEIARTVGRLVADLKRASSEFQGRLNEEVGKFEFEDPTKNLLGSLAEGLKAIRSVREPATAIMDLAEAPKIKEQLSGPSFIDNLSEYLEKTGGSAEAPTATQPAAPTIAPDEANKSFATEKEAVV